MALKGVCLLCVILVPIVCYVSCDFLCVPFSSGCLTRSATQLSCRRSWSAAAFHVLLHRSWAGILWTSFQSVFPVDYRLKLLHFVTIFYPILSMLRCCWLVGRKGIRPVKKLCDGCWHGYLSGTICRFAYGLADATATHCLLLQ